MAEIQHRRRPAVQFPPRPAKHRHGGMGLAVLRLQLEREEEDSMKAATIGMALLATAGTAHGAECVDAMTAKTGFVLEMPGVRSEFRPAAWFRSPTHTSRNRRRRSISMPG
ncbi:hypothetical protein [Mesorhizobium sp.]|uniref:hypothetical protein n=1 Tax=Mesorhizobium sp. TaxID=1871066 RepID=UPI0025C46171|nr:hypothetical protein [Mesorhizobium sp.]